MFVDDVEVPRLSERDAHHLRRVLRARAGDPITVTDGTGRWRTARLGDEPEPTGPVVQESEPSVVLTVAFALVKGDRPELVVQKLTELGIDRIVPLRAERSVVRWDEGKAGAAVDRLRTVARAAAMQSHRPRLPEVARVTDLSALAAVDGVALADRSGAPPTLAHPTLVVGPEGGWAPSELALGLPRVALGGLVLRAETAAITAGALLSALRGGLVQPHG